MSCASLALKGPQGMSKFNVLHLKYSNVIYDFTTVYEPF